MSDSNNLEGLEIDLLLEGIHQHYGYDFRDYAPASLKRRLKHTLLTDKLNTVSGFQEKVLHDPTCMKRFLLNLSIDVTAMFRDPTFYKSFREKVVTLIQTHPLIRIWHAGCSTGEEVFSMAILFREEGLYEKVRIYATDMNEEVLQKAKEGIFPLKVMQDYTENYLRGGGIRSFSEYYTAKYEHAILKPELQKNIVWAQHNLATDASFNEFQIIFCRNVMIYFNQSLQDRVHKLFYDSLAVNGVLGLGSKESLKFSPFRDYYEDVDGKERIFRKVK